LRLDPISYPRRAVFPGAAPHRSPCGICNLLTIQPRAQVSDIKNHIENSLKRRAQIEANNIHVTVAGNKVTLDGSVKAWAERYAAENAAWATPGVYMVDNRLHVA
jgi:osmotically-inducible protein OsmY